jgi:hypothetical protein
MKVFLLSLVLLVGVTLGQDQQIPVGEIDFYGYAGLDLTQIRSSLPLREGDKLSFAGMDQTIQRLTREVKQSTGYQPTNVAPVCCDAQGNLMVYIGLPGKSSKSLRLNAPPHDSIRLPANIVKLYQQTMDLLMESVQKQASEDRSQGYGLSSYPPLRTRQLAMREYATHHEPLVRRVLQSSLDAEQRGIAAEILGYGRQSKQQIAALVLASRDVDDGVRNNAVRALGVLALSSPKVARRIPATGFFDLLNSGVWKDRNKTGILFDALSQARDPKLLGRLRSQALESLIEMARWRDPGHAQSAGMVLGRIAGIEEDRLHQLVASGQVEVIIKALQKTR